ncbi:MAG: DUF1572 family protein [Chitinophagaceae bacterium]|nr:DUF1572 family protein [Chitinophagaceae bacterium]MBK8953351.1 DUF1572 family protein [Chitinophagaceae bacterium]
MSSIGKDYLQTVIKRLKYYKDLGDKTFEQLVEWDFHYQANPESNSIAVIMQHISGNMLSRWTNFLTEDGEKVWRKRDAEFEEQQKTKEELIAFWEEGWDCFLSAVSSLKKKDLKKKISIRGEKLTVTDAINRQLAHYPYHIGQIIYIAKAIKNVSWKNLSIPKGSSAEYNNTAAIKDPAKAF